jgi:hypothetical protein
VDGGVIDFDALLGEEFRVAAVGVPRLRSAAMNCRWGSSLEAPLLPLVAVQGKMSVLIIAVKSWSQNQDGSSVGTRIAEAKSSVGTGIHWKGGRRCFG